MFAADPHGAELVDGKWTPVLSNAGLAENHRSGAVESDCDSQDPKEREEQDQGDSGEKDVGRALRCRKGRMLDEVETCLQWPSGPQEIKRQKKEL